jgi:hypothetical protein
MDKLDALESAIHDAEYMAHQLRHEHDHSQTYLDQAEALQLLLAEIRGA